MKAARYYGPQQVWVEEVPAPAPPGPGEVVLRIVLAALCGTDTAQYRAATMIPLRHPHPVSGQQAPLILGHEMVGEVVAVGPGVEELGIGQAVVPGAAWWCDTCGPCLAGRPNICQHTYLYGIHANGGLAEYVRLPAKMCVPVPGGCPLEAAVLAQPLAVALHALDRADIRPGQVVAIFGIGGIGSLLLALCSGDTSWTHPAFRPAAVIAVDVDPARLAMAARLGSVIRVNAATSDPVLALQQICGGGVHVAIEATGKPEVVSHALASLTRGGRLLQVGIPTGQVSLPLGDLVLGEKEITTTNGQICQRDLPRALDLLATTSLAERISTRIIDLDDLVEQGLRPLAENRASAKILVRLPHAPHAHNEHNGHHERKATEGVDERILPTETVSQTCATRAEHA